MYAVHYKNKFIIHLYNIIFITFLMKMHITILYPSHYSIVFIFPRNSEQNTPRQNMEDDVHYDKAIVSLEVRPAF